LLGFVAVLLAQTEAALVAIPSGLLLAFYFSDAKRSRKLAMTGIAVAVLAFALVLPVTQSKLLLQDYSGEVRRAQWKESIQFITDNPAFGAGLNGYATAISPYHDPTLYEIFQYPHNIILNIWTELGLLGIFVFFWLVILTVREMRRPNPNPIKLAAFAALATMTIHGLVDVPYFKNDLSVMTWILIAILATPFDKAPSSR
jgi:putative inorganic carbon (HCO3(-)) transporter